jgi:hypothetical protein
MTVSKSSSAPRLIAATFRLSPEILEGLSKVKARDGVPVSEQVRRALINWLRARKALGRGHTKGAT